MISNLVGRLSGKGSSNFDVYLEQGRIELEARDFHKAVEYLGKAFKEAEGRRPSKRSLQWAHIYAGKAEYSLRNYSESEKHFDLAIQIDPKFPTAWYSKGCSLMEQKSYEKAFKHFEKAYELNTGFDDALASMGDALFAMGEFERAVEKYRMLLEVKPNSKYAPAQIEKVMERMRQREEDKKNARDKKWMEGILKK